MVKVFGSVWNLDVGEASIVESTPVSELDALPPTVYYTSAARSAGRAKDEQDTIRSKLHLAASDLMMPLPLLSPPAWALEALLGSRGWGLPEELVEMCLGLLRVRRVCQQEVEVVGCSSRQADHPLASVLERGGESWWISAAPAVLRSEQSMEYLDFQLSGDGTARRLSFLGVRIPPLPNGPCSVRRFRLLFRGSKEEPWREVADKAQKVQAGSQGQGETVDRAKEWKTLDVGVLQEIALWPPIDAIALRFLCTQNAFGEAFPRGQPSTSLFRMAPITQMGIFEVRFS